MAKEKGYYADRNLDVHFEEFNNKINNLQSIIEGNAEFAIGRSSLLIDKGKGADIVALLAGFQRSPFMLLTRAFTGIDKPADLRGRRIMLTQDSANSGELIAMLTKAGLSTSDYIPQQHSFNVNDLINGHTDAISSYVSNEPYKLIQQGIPYNILHPADYGFDMYADILYTSGKLIRRNPELVDNFYEASIQGWKYAFANITETVSIIHEKYNTQNRSKEALIFEAQELKKLAFDEHKNFGTLLSNKFESMSQIYLLTGFIDRKPDLQDFIYKPPAGKLNLTYEELIYIKHKKSIKICVQKYWPPYELVSNNKYQGIIAEFLKLIRDKTGMSITHQIVESSQQAQSLTTQGVCDITTTANDQLNTNFYTEKNLLTSKPFINITLAYLSDNKATKLSQLNYKAAVPSKTPCYHCLNKIIPNANKVAVSSAEKGIELLRKNQVSSVIASEAHLRYLLSMNNISDLYINESQVIDASFSFSMNLQHSALHSILNKSLDLISQQERDRILSKWMTTSPDNKINQQLVWISIAVMISITLFLLYRYLVEKLRANLLKELSETDPLTGIANRRKLLEQLQNHIDLSNRYGSNLSIIFFDIDNFKNINDQYGHKTGDRILQEIASLIKKQVRKTDVFARWGGEEFILINPETKIEDTKNRATILLHQIHQHDFNLDRHVTCSFGITQYLKDESLDNFINRADESMYQAKRKGKNQVDVTELPVVRN